MNDTIIVAIIGAVSTIVVPVITWHLTSKTKEKEKINALDSMQKDHEHELEKLKYLHSHELASKEKDLEIAVAKLQAEAESAKDLDQSKFINDMLAPVFQSQMNNPDSYISKAINQELKEAIKQNNRKFVRNK